MNAMRDRRAGRTGTDLSALQAQRRAAMRARGIVVAERWPPASAVTELGRSRGPGWLATVLAGDETPPGASLGL
jgi:hypothetical protein